MPSYNGIYFNSSDGHTLGVEVELQILNSNTLEMAPGAPLFLKAFASNPHIKEELLDSILEINTQICRNIHETREDLRTTLTDILNFAEEHDYSILSMGTHPFSNWKDQQVAANPRYDDLISRMQWPLRKLLITGVHVHIGVDSGEKAIAVTNGLTRYIPHLIALSANSPFHDGELTGLASTRNKIFEGLPTAGLPQNLRNYSEFQKFMRTLKKAHSIESIREVWWDVRPHPSFGTVEIRVMDSMSKLEDIVRLAAYCQCLVAGISSHYDNGTQLPLLDNWVLLENKWRAIRYGLEAEIITDDETLKPIKTVISNTVERLMPIAEKLECQHEMQDILLNLEQEIPAYSRQIELYQENPDLKEILKEFVNMFKTSVLQ